MPVNLQLIDIPPIQIFDVAPNGDIYAVTYDDAAIYKINTSGHVEFGIVGVFDEPNYDVGAIFIDDKNNVYLSDLEYNEIIKFRSEELERKKENAAWESVLKLDRFADSEVSSFVLDSMGNFYVGDTLSGISKYTPDGKKLWTWGSSGTAGIVNTFGITIDEQDNLYLANPNYPKIIKLSNNGTLLFEFNLIESHDKRESIPFGIDVDQHGNLYIANFGYKRIQVFDSNGTRVHSTNLNNHITHPIDIRVDYNEGIVVNDLSMSAADFFDPLTLKKFTNKEKNYLWAADSFIAQHRQITTEVRCVHYDPNLNNSLDTNRNTDHAIKELLKNNIHDKYRITVTNPGLDVNRTVSVLARCHNADVVKTDIDLYNHRDDRELGYSHSVTADVPLDEIIGISYENEQVDFVDYLLPPLQKVVGYSWMEKFVSHPCNEKEIEGVEILHELMSPGYFSPRDGDCGCLCKAQYRSYLQVLDQDVEKMREYGYEIVIGTRPWRGQ